MHIVIGADHGGYDLKPHISDLLDRLGHQVTDVGAHTYDSTDDYPDFAVAVAESVTENRADRGIMICGSGVGAAVVANKIRGVRASVCHDSYSARQGVEHDDMNVLCLGARIVGSELAKVVVTNFLEPEFSGEERHQRRLDKILEVEGTSR